MTAINTTVIQGALGADAQIKVFQNGGVQVVFSLAHTKRYKDANNNVVEKTSWFTVRKNGKQSLGDYAAQYLLKGQQAIVSGELVEDTWNDNQSGEKRRATAIDVTRGEISLIGDIKGKNSAQNQQQPAQQQQRQAAPQQQRQAAPQQQQRQAAPAQQQYQQQRQAAPQQPAYQAPDANGYDFDTDFDA